MDERRYSDDEVAAIFEAASAPLASRPSSEKDGLTLTELQAIGREVGIAPHRIADAARGLQPVAGPIQRHRDFGMPLSAGHVVEIPRPLTDREWSLLVADLRETFAARGKESSHGETREWSNGNLHAYVEPTPNGYRLRLGTLKGDAPAVNRMGAAAIGLAWIAAVASAVRGDPMAALPAVVALGGTGVGFLAMNAFRLPRWIRLRERQMQEVAERARAMLEVRSTDDQGRLTP